MLSLGGKNVSKNSIFGRTDRITRQRALVVEQRRKKDRDTKKD